MFTTKINSQSVSMWLIALFTMFMLLPSQQVQAQVISVDALEISGLGNYKGQYLTVYYGNGRRPSLNVGTSHFDIKSVHQKLTFKIESDSVVSPRQQISMVGKWPFRTNFIALIIHPSNKVTYSNPDGSAPEHEEVGNPKRASRLDSITLDELKRFSEEQKDEDGNAPAVIKYQLR